MSFVKLDGVVEKLPASAWLHHRDTLYRLYIAENKPLSVVKQTMEDEHGFVPQRLCDYEVAIRDVLRFRKNLKREEWRAISIRISERKRQAKESEVIWNNAPFEAKKLRKELQRNGQPKSGVAEKVNPELPQGLVIRTPPRSPATCAAVLLPSLEPSLANAPRDSTHDASDGTKDPVNSLSVDDETIGEVQRALLEAGEFGVSPYRKLRANLPFNRFMSQIVSLAQLHQLRFCIPNAETWTPVSPRLFGANPSWDLLGGQIYRLSNKISRILDSEDIWFLKWLGISADTALLKSFFSINSPSAGAVYEDLLEKAGNLRMTDLLRVLFSLRHALMLSNRTSFNVTGFVHAIVQIRLGTDDCLDILHTCLSTKPPLSTTTDNDFRGLIGSSVLTAAERGDIAMLRVLVNLGWKVESRSQRYNATSMGQLMKRIYDWDLQKMNDLTVYIDLLFRGGVLDGTASSLCSNNERPQVMAEGQTMNSITWDELIIICPPVMRKTLQMAFARLRVDQETGISRAGVFTVAQDGVTGLRSYLEIHREDEPLQTREALEECLLYSAIVNDSKTALSLLELGVDPYIGLIFKSLERRQKGTPCWSPTIVAAAVGSLEVLSLLLRQNGLWAFLDTAPIHYLVQHKTILDTSVCGAVGTELRRLSNLHHYYLQAQTPSGGFAIELNLHGTQLGNGGIRTVRNFEILEYIRSLAHSRNYGRKTDLAIIKAAVYQQHRDWLAVSRQHLPCEALLMKGLIDAHLEYQEGGMDLLHLSIRNNCSFAIVRFLSDKGFAVHSKPDAQNRNTMLHDALLSTSPDRSDIVEFLLKEGADCNACADGLSILEASLWNVPNVPMGLRDSAGFHSEFRRIFERLLDAGATVCHWPRRYFPEWRPLVGMLLRIQASSDLILRVIDAGAPLNICGYGQKGHYSNLTPLQAAVFFRREALARELICRMADVHAPASPEIGLTALQAACLRDLPVHFLEYLVVVLGVDVNEHPAKLRGLTSLAAAVFGGSLNTVEFLLEHGADINAMCSAMRFAFDFTRGFYRPLDYAVSRGCLDMVELLLKAGGCSSKAGLGGAIEIAARGGHFAILSVLRIWNDKHGRQILEEEALWQRRNPGQALMLSEPTQNSDYSDSAESKNVWFYC